MPRVTWCKSCNGNGFNLLRPNAKSEYTKMTCPCCKGKGRVVCKEAKNG